MLWIHQLSSTVRPFCVTNLSHIKDQGVKCIRYIHKHTLFATGGWRGRVSSFKLPTAYGHHLYLFLFEQISSMTFPKFIKQLAHLKTGHRFVFQSCRTFIQDSLFYFAALLHVNNQKLCQSLHAHMVLVSQVPARASLLTVFTPAVYTK